MKKYCFFVLFLVHIVFSICAFVLFAANVVEPIGGGQPTLPKGVGQPLAIIAGFPFLDLVVLIIFGSSSTYSPWVLVFTSILNSAAVAATGCYLIIRARQPRS